MKKTTRRILALALSLALICALAATCWAQYLAVEEGPEKTFDTIDMIAGVGIAEYSVAGYVDIAADTANELKRTTVTANIGLTYTYCPEDAFRPSNYMTGTKGGNAYYLGNNDTSTARETRIVYSTGTLTLPTYGDCVVLEATGRFVINYTTPHSSGEYTPDPINVVNNTI